MEFSITTTERLGSDSLQFQKNNHVLMPSQCLENDKVVIETKVSATTTNNNNHHDEQLAIDITLTLESLLGRIDTPDYPIVTATTSQTSIYDSCTKVSIITTVKLDDEDDNKTKDIVLLRNLEITPPPQDLIAKVTPSPNANVDAKDSKSSRRASKRTNSEQSDESSISLRSKRQRRQTELFQVESVQKSNTTRKQAKPDIPQIPQVEQRFPDVIFYEKGDHLAIRNEENTFYLGQLTENVRDQKPFVKVRWLDTEDGGTTYYLTSHYDKVPQKSIIMPVELNKLKADKKSKQIFTIDDQIKNSVLDRLKRSINMPVE